MSHFNNQADITTNVMQPARSRPHQTCGFWLLLTSGSILLHLVLIYLVNQSAHRSLSQPVLESAVAIDFVELPVELPVELSAIESTASPSPVAEAASSSAAAPRANSITTIEAISSTEVVPPQITTAPSASFRAAAPLASPIPTATPVPPTPDEAELDAPLPPPTRSRQALNPATPTPETVEADLPATPPPATPPPATPLQQPALAPRLPTPSPSPLIVTQPIDLPVPDVTGVLPTQASPADADADATDETEQTASEVTEQITVPSELTASLTAAPLEDNIQPLDEVAYPKQDVHTFPANSTHSPCVVRPEAVPFLGKTVAMQVMTNERGQVVDTVTQESSESAAYDELATCLVKNWDFEPGTAEGQPVSTEGLVVRITIEAEG